ncbi:tail fiber protein [Erwinia tracheiphila]
MPPVGTVQSSAPRWFTEGGGGTPASYPGAAWYNIIQAELLNFLSAYGIAPDKAQFNQLQVAIEEAISQKATAASPLLAAIAALVTSANKMPYFTGKDKVAMTDLTAFARTLLSRDDAAGVLSDLGLGDGSALPVGVPVPWPLATAPTGWLKCNGAAFSATDYPQLAKAYTSLTLPDLRGEFIRGWDDGRGADGGRTLLSSQAHAFQQHTHTYTGLQRATDSDRGSNDSLWSIDGTQSYTTSGATGSTTTETRPRNVAFNYIVRAA